MKSSKINRTESKSYHKNGILLPKHVLLIPLEFDTWERECHCSYVNQWGLEDGLKANGVNCFTLLSPWLKKSDLILAGKNFDQIWIEIVHHDFDNSFLERIKTLAPIRLGLIAESLEYSLDEIALNEGLNNRKKLVWDRLKYFTHVLAVDEKDVADINKEGKSKALWWAPAIPRKFITDIHLNKEMLQKPAFFSGAIYGKRNDFFNCHSLKMLLCKNPSPDGKFYPFVFDWLHKFTRLFIKLELPGANMFYFLYYRIVRYVKNKCFKRWLNSLRKGCAVVNLPSMVKAYPGRVIEAIAVGQPVISWKIPHRPLNEKLFKEEEEMLFFDKDKPEQLVQQIQRIQMEEGLVDRLVRNSKDKVIRKDTMERRIGQILNWLENNETPNYFESY